MRCDGPIPVRLWCANSAERTNTHDYTTHWRAENFEEKRTGEYCEILSEIVELRLKIRCPVTESSGGHCMASRVIKGPITVPVSLLSAVECYPCR